MASSKNSLSVLLMAFVLMAVVSELANASSITLYRLGGCSGETRTYSNCGCSNLLYMGGYSFSYTGQTARLYNTGNCLGGSVATLNGNARQCSGVGWRSINIQC
ncbi:hypothetical protein C5167_030548 [Papaver somniferum]|uniref:antimicrobial peptide 1-like n=1 Tax=Papaver somniferum TaxID=3469 RepID=UPI000E7003B1|nr:antimicrobial peptide 1-like [Papaver somniferum]RZC86469.1 hypothetical protein C5167_030548 [Papaver somniferum]